MVYNQNPARPQTTHFTIRYRAHRGVDRWERVASVRARTRSAPLRSCCYRREKLYLPILEVSRRSRPIAAAASKKLVWQLKTPLSVDHWSERWVTRARRCLDLDSLSRGYRFRECRPVPWQPLINNNSSSNNNNNKEDDDEHIRSEIKCIAVFLQRDQARRIVTIVEREKRTGLYWRYQTQILGKESRERIEYLLREILGIWRRRLEELRCKRLRN